MSPTVGEACEAMWPTPGFKDEYLMAVDFAEGTLVSASAVLHRKRLFNGIATHVYGQCRVTTCLHACYRNIHKIQGIIFTQVSIVIFFHS